MTEHSSKRFKSGQERDVTNDVSSDVSVSRLPPARPATVRHSKVSRRIPNSDFMAVTSFDGQRVYVTMKSESFVKQQVYYASRFSYVFACDLISSFLISFGRLLYWPGSSACCQMLDMLSFFCCNVLCMCRNGIMLSLHSCYTVTFE